MPDMISYARIEPFVRMFAENGALIGLETVFRFAHERHKFRQVRLGDRATDRLLRRF